MNGAVAVLTWKHAEVLPWWTIRLRARWPIQCYSSIASASDSWGVVVDQARRPTDAELRRNSRARSAVLHVHRKSRGTRLSDLEAKAGAALNWAPHIIPVPAERGASTIAGARAPGPGRRGRAAAEEVQEEEARRGMKKRSKKAKKAKKAARE